MSNEVLLIEAVKSGDTKTVERLLLEEAALAKMLVNVEMLAPQTDNSTGAYAQPMSLLMLALISEHSHAVDIISLLLAAGADINAQVEVIVPDFGATALAVAIISGDLKTAQLLVERGANVNAVDPKTGDTPLHQLARLPYEDYEPSLALLEFDLIPAMLERGADPKAKNAERHTPIKMALATGKFLLVDLLTQYQRPVQVPVACVTETFPSSDLLVRVTPANASLFVSCAQAQQQVVVPPASLMPQSTERSSFSMIQMST